MKSIRLIKIPPYYSDKVPFRARMVYSLICTLAIKHARKTHKSLTTYQPKVKAIAKELDFNPHSVRKAMDDLISAGYLSEDRRWIEPPNDAYYKIKSPSPYLPHRMKYISVQSPPAGWTLVDSAVINSHQHNQTG